MGRKKISGRFENISTASLTFVAGKQVLVAKELIEAASVNDRLYDGVFHRFLWSQLSKACPKPGRDQKGAVVKG
jgi:hypothetical protein